METLAAVAAQMAENPGFVENFPVGLENARENERVMRLARHRAHRQRNRMAVPLERPAFRFGPRAGRREPPTAVPAGPMSAAEMQDVEDQVWRNLMHFEPQSWTLVDSSPFGVREEKECLVCMEKITSKSESESESKPLRLPCGKMICSECIVSSAPGFSDKTARLNLKRIDDKTEIRCACGCNNRLFLKSLPQELQEKIRECLTEGQQFRDAVANTSSESTLDSKHCPACQFPCSKEVERHEVAGLAGGTNACNHITCPSCNARLCFACMCLATSAEHHAARCPSYDVAVACVSMGADWAAWLEGLDTCVSVAVVDMDRPDAPPRVCAAFDPRQPAPVRHPTVPTATHAVVHVSRGIVKRVVAVQGDLPFKQLLVGAAVELCDEDGRKRTIPNTAFNSMRARNTLGMFRCTVHTRNGVAESVETSGDFPLGSIAPSPNHRQRAFFDFSAEPDYRQEDFEFYAEPLSPVAPRRTYTIPASTPYQFVDVGDFHPAFHMLSTRREFHHPGPTPRPSPLLSPLPSPRTPSGNAGVAFNRGTASALMRHEEPRAVPHWPPEHHEQHLLATPESPVALHCEPLPYSFLNTLCCEPELPTDLLPRAAQPPPHAIPIHPLDDMLPPPLINMAQWWS